MALPTRDDGSAVRGTDAVTIDGLWIFPLREAAVTTRSALITAGTAMNLVLFAVLILQSVLLIVGEPGSVVPWLLVPLLVLTTCEFLAWRFDPLSIRLYILLTVIALAGFSALTVAVAESPAQAYAGTAGFLLSVSKSLGVITWATADRWTGGIAGGLFGYIATESTTVATAFVVGLPYRFDAPPLLLAIGLGVCYASFPLARARSRGRSDTLAAADRRMRVRRVREREGRESIARLHDTILGALAALSSREPGPLTDAERLMIERGLESSAMLPALRADAAPDLASGAWIRAVGEAAGLRVAIEGDPSALATLPPSATEALRGAVEQCLVNVARHAGVSDAWVTVARDGDGVSVTVIDEGVGFDPDTVPHDRLGLSESVRGRIERLGGRVRVWSSPGSGTSVHLSVPYAAEGGA
ncbi:MAG: hypothetical protein EAS51_02345 [Microbacteriaceae bacterium]|nr:MAG: hypothetical protein EAS51_02345 [Microbacteriaceae bacterium]